MGGSCRDVRKGSGQVMGSQYRHTRQEVIALLYEWRDGSDVPMEAVRCFLLELAPTTEDIRWARQTSRKHGFIGKELPCDPRMEQILALDT